VESEIIIGGQQWPERILQFTLLVIAITMVLEMLVPRRDVKTNLARRWINNFSLSALTWYLATAASTVFIYYLVSLTRIWEFGLVPSLELGPEAAFLILLTVSQLLSYALHVAFHKISWLWPLHAIHHTDTEVDVSTAYRHHPLEPVVTLPLSVPVILLLGVQVEAAMAFKMVEIVMTLFSHSNLRLPERLDSVLRKFILTPDFHRLHHSSEARFTDSNYGSMVPWFDYLFGTASNRPYDEQTDMELGLEYLRQPRDSRLDRLVLIPFVWRRAITRNRA
jgi:sterol desaturase/sphingolipid hydroxylase (fatty acid hydroxylase superfamily)